jgi:zinc protease
LRRILPFTAASLAIFALTATSQALPQGVEKVTSVEGITEYVLPDGLHVLLFPDNSKPKVTVNMTYLVGSRHEGYGETGMAHLLEHMLFKETRSGRNIAKDLGDHGAQFNGSTWFDRTNYFETVAATGENLRWAIGLEADRMINVRVEKALLDTEMTVVRNEFEMGENNPAQILEQRTLEAAYTFHNYGKSTIGNRSDIEKVPIDRLQAFYQRYYQPDNAILTVAGQFDEPKTLAWIAEAFGSVPRPTRKLQQTYTVEPVQDGERSVTLRRVGDNQYIMAAYHGPAGSHPDAPALQVLSAILGESPSGRLYKALVDNKKAVSTAMEFTELHDPGYILATVRLREDQSLDEARQTTLKTIEGLLNEPPSKEEVERAKARIQKQIELALTNSQIVGVTLSETAAAGDWRLLFAGRDALRKVTEQDVARVAKAYLKESNRTLGVFIPTKNPDRAIIPETPDVAAMLKDYKGGAAIAQGEIFDPTPANIENRVTRAIVPGGLKLVMLPKKTRGGTVVATVNLRFGDEKSLVGKSAVSQMAGALLMRGTKNKSRQQIQDETDRLKVRLNVNGALNFATATMETTEEYLPAALRLAAEILREPSFPAAEFEQIRQQRIAVIEAGKSDPHNLAMIAMQRHLNSIYPRGDVRYVSTPEEQIEDLQKVTLEDVKSFYAFFYGASTGEFAVSGQFNRDEIQKLAAELFGNWKSAAPYARITGPYRKVDPLERSIKTPDKKNAYFIVGQAVKISDDDPDYPAVLLASYIFGMWDNSRLFQRIREKEGLSYGVMGNVSVPTKDDGGSFLGMAFSAPENTVKVDAAFREELARAIKDGFPADEVEKARKAWLQERGIQRSQDSALAGLLATRARYDRTLKFDEDVEAKVAAMTPQQISDAFRHHIDPAALAYFKAGDFK